MKPSTATKPTTATGLKPALLYAVLALIGGATLAVVVPPLQAPDEALHFARAYQVADGVLLPRNRRGELGGVLPSNIEASIRMAGATVWHPESNIKEFGSQFRQFQVPLDPTHTSFSAFPNTAVEPPFAYLPQALGIRVARMISDTVLGCMIGARVGNLLLVVTCIAWAIYLTPVFRWVLVVMALAPLTLGMAATSTSYGFTHAVLFIFVAVVLRVAYGPTAASSWRVIASLVAATIALSLVIQGYLPLLLLYLLIPVARLGTGKRYWLLFGGLVLIALAGGIAWELAVGGPLEADSLVAVHARALMEHPRQIGDVLKRGIGPPLPLATKTFAGPLITVVLNTGPIVSVVYPILMLLIAFLMLFIALLEVAPSTGHIGLSKRLIPLAAATLSITAIALLMFLTWPPVYFLQGIHPRQVIPVGFVALLFLVNAMPRMGKFGQFARGHMGWIVALYFVLRLGETLWVLNQRYYALGSS